MKLRAVLFITTIVVHIICTAAHAETVWLDGKIKDEGKTVCVYKSGFDKVYMPADVGDYCPLTIDK